MNIPADLKYTKDHEWIKFDGDIATIGVTDFAQKELGDIVHVELPGVGDKHEMNDQIVAVESTKTAADVYIMVEGEVVGVNEEVENDASLVNSSPEEEGWMVEIKVQQPGQLEELLTEDQYKEIAN